MSAGPTQSWPVADSVIGVLQGTGSAASFPCLVETEGRDHEIAAGGHVSVLIQGNAIDPSRHRALRECEGAMPVEKLTRPLPGSLRKRIIAPERETLRPGAVR